MTLYELRRELLIQIYLCESELKKASDPKTMHLAKSGNWESYYNIYTNILRDLDKEIELIKNRIIELKKDLQNTEDMETAQDCSVKINELRLVLGDKITKK